MKKNQNTPEKQVLTFKRFVVDSIVGTKVSKSYLESLFDSDL